MEELTSIGALRGWVRARRGAGQRIGFVPTMGFLHEGHLSLVDAARREADAVVMSIFVNPLQFAPGEDLDRYPRDLPRDRALAEARGVDALFLPQVSDMYPPGSEVRVVPGPTANRWEGEVRPGHFAGVLTVVAKLFHLVEPDVACFGQKDIQQATLVRQMVRDLDWPVGIRVCRTTRDADGLALSSRNTYLSAEERAQGLGLSRALRRGCERFAAGVRRTSLLEAEMREVLSLHPGVAVEYIAVVCPENLEPVAEAGADSVVVVAGRVGRTRLIDNVILGEGL
ncbi:MAG TPA: pantoate--beta-alanine ligase [Gemmatimonadales bacterium]|nr:pantoate--beta-alanine ligase [Gemmatimonadales bacterium]